jgi:hypothetical protein
MDIVADICYKRETSKHGEKLKTEIVKRTGGGRERLGEDSAIRERHRRESCREASAAPSSSSSRGAPWGS